MPNKFKLKPEDRNYADWLGRIHQCEGFQPAFLCVANALNQLLPWPKRGKPVVEFTPLSQEEIKAYARLGSINSVKRGIIWLEKNNFLAVKSPPRRRACHSYCIKWPDDSIMKNVVFKKREALKNKTKLQAAIKSKVSNPEDSPTSDIGAVSVEPDENDVTPNSIQAVLNDSRYDRPELAHLPIVTTRPPVFPIYSLDGKLLQ